MTLRIVPRKELLQLSNCSCPSLNILQVFSPKLFDSQIQPISTYGSETWGLFSDQEYIESVHLSALKTFIGVSPKSPRHLINGETGSYPESGNECFMYLLTHIIDAHTFG